MDPWGRPPGWVPPPGTPAASPVPVPVRLSPSRMHGRAWVVAAGVTFAVSFVCPVAGIVAAFVVGAQNAPEPGEATTDGWAEGFLFIGGFFAMVVLWVVALLCLVAMGIATSVAQLRERRAYRGW